MVNFNLTINNISSEKKYVKYTTNINLHALVGTVVIEHLFSLIEHAEVILWLVIFIY